VAEVRERIETQLRRAARPTIPVNTHAPVSDSLLEKKRKLDKKRRQRKDWEET
jgi:hypothetical protein